MNLKIKLERLEKRACVDETCLVCEMGRVGASLFYQERARLGVVVEKVSTEIEEDECVECGRPEYQDVSGIPAATRRQIRSLRAEIYGLIRARDRTEKNRLGQLIGELDDIAQTSFARELAAYSEDEAQLIRQAYIEAEAGFAKWCEAHDAQLKQMISRPPLIVRRGFAA
jgi:hypothetical protein